MSDMNFGSVPENEIRELNRLIETERWKVALDRDTLPTISEKKDWFTKKRKGFFYLSLDLHKKDIALDIGAGSGVISEVISDRFKQVIACDFNFELCRFMRRRFEQDGIRNIRVIQGSANKLPFAEESFDLVIVNGLLEWIPSTKTDSAPKKAQIDFLQSVFHKLRRNGKVVIAIENRFYYRHIFGQKKPHNDIKFTTVLPRFLSNLICRVSRNDIYRNYIYSYWGYKRLLKKVGFDNIEILLALPSYYTPNYVVPLENEIFFYYYSKFYKNQPSYMRTSYMKKMVYSILCRIGVMKYFEHSFYVVGEKRD